MIKAPTEDSDKTKTDRVDLAKVENEKIYKISLELATSGSPVHSVVQEQAAFDKVD